MSVLFSWSLNDRHELFCDPDAFIKEVYEAVDLRDFYNDDICARGTIEMPLTTDMLLSLTCDTAVCIRDMDGDYDGYLYVRCYKVYIGDRQFLAEDEDEDKDEPELTIADP